MTEADVTARGTDLGRRAWTASGAILPVAGGGTLATVCIAAGLTSGWAQAVTIVAALVIGVGGGLLWAARRGADAIHRRVAAERAAWVQTRRDASLQPDGPADERDVALALPRGWRVEAARGRVQFLQDGAAVRAETWVLRAVVGSRRAPRRREVVVASAPTGAARVSVPLGVVADSMLVTPAWVRAGQTNEPAWMPAVRERVARHDDLPASLSIGDDRVILFALDDPRTETMLARASLVRDVATMIR